MQLFILWSPNFEEATYDFIRKKNIFLSLASLGLGWGNKNYIFSSYKYILWLLLFLI